MARDESFQKLVEAEKKATDMVARARQEADRLVEHSREEAAGALAEIDGLIAGLRAEQDASLRQDMDAAEKASRERIRKVSEAIDSQLAANRERAVQAVVLELTRP